MCSSAKQTGRRSALQGSRLVRTVRPYAQRMALIPQAIELKTRMHCRTIGAKCHTFQRLTEQVLATEPRAKQEARSIFIILSVNSQVVIFEQSENITSVHFLD